MKLIGFMTQPSKPVSMYFSFSDSCSEADTAKIGTRALRLALSEGTPEVALASNLRIILVAAMPSVIGIYESSSVKCPSRTWLVRSHLNIHQDDVKNLAIRLKFSSTSLTVSGEYDRMAKLGQTLLHDFAVDWIVFSH